MRTISIMQRQGDGLRRKNASVEAALKLELLKRMQRKQLPLAQTAAFNIAAFSHQHVGFGSQAAFSRAFTRRYGYPPSSVPQAG